MKKFLSIFSMVALMVVVLVVPASAASYPPSLGIEGQVVYSTYNGSYQAVHFYKSLPVSFQWTGHQILAYPGYSSAYYQVYNWDASTQSWVTSGNQTEFTNGETAVAMNIGWTLYNCTDDIYDTNGELFFPFPPDLSEVVQTLTLEQGKVTLGQALGVMKTLVPCGVGCLALLMAFPVLRKGLLRFLH